MPFFNFKDVQIYYETEGNGRPLLLINGLSADTRQWEFLQPLLKDSFQVVAYDMRCAGRSSCPSEPFTVGDLSDEAAALLSHLKIDKAAALGFSMGGMVAMDLAIRRPLLVERLVLLSTAPGFKRPHPPSRETMEIFHRTDVSPELLAKVYDLIFGPEFKKKNDVQDFITFRLNDEMPQPVDSYLKQLSVCEATDLFDDVKRIAAPALIIAGSDDKVIPPANSEWLHGQNI